MPLVLLVLLTLISWQVAVAGPLLRVDVHARQVVHELRHWLMSSLFDSFDRGLADLGNAVLAIPVLLGAAALAASREQRAGGRRWWIPLPTAALTALLIPLLIVPSKEWFARPGPLGELIGPDHWGFYPSGHAATSAIAYGTAALLVGRTLADETAGRLLYAATALLCLGVGIGLVWNDFHWLLDVLGSWCLAGLVLWSLARWVPTR